MNPDEERRFLSNLRVTENIEEVLSPGTGKIRYCWNHKGFQVDMSIRDYPEVHSVVLPLSAVAQERAANCDAGISSVALDPSGKTFATPEYEVDKSQKTITMYQSTGNEARLLVYAERMQKKFPEFRVIWKEEETNA